METVVHCPAQGTLQSAMKMLIDVFQAHAQDDADKLHLNRWEMKDLFKRELLELIQNSKEPFRSFEIMDNLDKNRDCKVDFEEFVSVATKLIMLSHPYFNGGCNEDCGAPRCGVR
ncbi:protein S100-A1-like [Plectropomus leopardus]|uniref:protein S100-A1-like n=1 Tax=Plectropomus leopardus TaxID=160734 RepID=UPI001C4A8CEF|nr:protein S100-A1-like [Plectropomus leopardus]